MGWFAGILSFGIVTSFFIPVNSEYTLISQNRCQSNGGVVYEWLLEKVDISEFAEALPIACKELNAIEGYIEESIQVTTGRKSGVYIICLSNSMDNPCKHKIASLSGYQNPSSLLSKVLKIPEVKPKFLNETVERLFINPSSLIR